MRNSIGSPVTEAQKDEVKKDLETAVSEFTAREEEAFIASHSNPFVAANNRTNFVAIHSRLYQALMLSIERSVKRLGIPPNSKAFKEVSRIISNVRCTILHPNQRSIHLILSMRSTCTMVLVPHPSLSCYSPDVNYNLIPSSWRMLPIGSAQGTLTTALSTAGNTAQFAESMASATIWRTRRRDSGGQLLLEWGGSLLLLTMDSFNPHARLNKRIISWGCGKKLWDSTLFSYFFLKRLLWTFLGQQWKINFWSNLPKCQMSVGVW